MRQATFFAVLAFQAAALEINGSDEDSKMRDEIEAAARIGEEIKTNLVDWWESLKDEDDCIDVDTGVDVWSRFGDLNLTSMTDDDAACVWIRAQGERFTWLRKYNMSRKGNSFHCDKECYLTLDEYISGAALAVLGQSWYSCE